MFLVVYMLMGHWLSEMVLKKKKADLVISVFVILGSFGSSIYDAYRSIFQDLDPIWNKVYSVCKFLSPYSFGVYLSHQPPLEVVVGD